ncbi:MAG TPA: lipid carrier--UDP-N-acetylgalactosaminyltransferase [Lachnospiraceae bacterium]|nr:lipid carrier--UDP-N-acetylgalactosaminyltransferase [Lachnospiraceae bacterium]
MMKENLLLVGSGGLGRVVSEHTRERYDCYFVDDGYEVNTKICGIKIVGKIKDLDKLYPEYNNLIVTIGDNVLREKIYVTAKKIGYSFPNVICSTSYVSPYAQIGQGCIFLNNTVVQNGAEVGNGVILNPGVEIHHDSKISDYALIYTNSVIRTFAKVGKRAKLGSNVTISNEVIVKADEIIDDGKDRVRM